MSFNLNSRTIKRRGLINDSSNENVLVRCNKDNFNVTDIHSNLRLCTRCSRYCSECCGLHLLSNCTNTYLFCENCAKLALNAVFVEKCIEERSAIFLESISKRVIVLEGNSSNNSDNLKGLETSIECNNLNINICYSSMENLRVDLLERTKTKQVPPTITTTNLWKSAVDGTTVNPSNFVSTDSPILINQLKD